MKKGSKCLTWVQRLQLEALFKAKLNFKDIAKQIGVSYPTVYREYKRGLVVQRKAKRDIYGDIVGYDYYKVYSADVAEDHYRKNLTAKGRNLKLGNDYEFIRYIEYRVLKEHITPHALVGEINKKNLPYLHISFTTLYRYIRMGLFSRLQMNDILKSRQKHYEKATAKRAPRGTSIEKRPEEIMQRVEFGHWEMDSICCDKLSTFLTLTERLTRKEIIFKMPNQRAESVVKCLNQLEFKYGKKFKQIFKSITVDNGSEFSDFAGMERSIFNKLSKRTNVYYCHPYSAYERGTNERMNREVRRLVPKGTDLTGYTVDEVQRIEDWVNSYPRSVLGYYSSQELFELELANL